MSERDFADWNAASLDRLVDRSGAILRRRDYDAVVAERDEARAALGAAVLLMTQSQKDAWHASLRQSSEAGKR